MLHLASIICGSLVVTGVFVGILATCIVWSPTHGTDINVMLVYMVIMAAAVLATVFGVFAVVVIESMYEFLERSRRSHAAYGAIEIHV